ncbi:unnamed protein product [Somion occarium]|uniref:Uncharacterized protein n=1 Tax=Somion occarium TaxID=3059160 RepID=A0ABP1CZ14_9APHY
MHSDGTYPSSFATVCKEYYCEPLFQRTVIDVNPRFCCSHQQPPEVQMGALQLAEVLALLLTWIGRNLGMGREVTHKYQTDLRWFQDISAAVNLHHSQELSSWHTYLSSAFSKYCPAGGNHLSSECPVLSSRENSCIRDWLLILLLWIVLYRLRLNSSSARGTVTIPILDQ